MVENVGKIIGVVAIGTGLVLVLFYVLAYGGNPLSSAKLKNLNAISNPDVPLSKDAAPPIRISFSKDMEESEIADIKSEAYLRPKMSEHANGTNLNPASVLSATPNTERSTLPIEGSSKAVTGILNESENTQVLIKGYGSDLFVNQMHPRDWEDPNWSEIDKLANAKLNFPPIDINRVTRPSFLSGPAVNLRIPSISVDSKVEELDVIVKDGIKQYETPKNVVGRIPTDPDMLNSVTGWYFGHLESPIKGEGNVFHALPKVADDIRNGDPVYIILSTDKKEFTYEAIKSEVMHESSLKLYDAGPDAIILVTCANRPLYDHRQIVTARLIGIAP